MKNKQLTKKGKKEIKKCLQLVTSNLLAEHDFQLFAKKLTQFYQL